MTPAMRHHTLRYDAKHPRGADGLGDEDVVDAASGDGQLDGSPLGDASRDALDVMESSSDAPLEANEAAIDGPGD